MHIFYKIAVFRGEIDVKKTWFFVKSTNTCFQKNYLDSIFRGNQNPYKHKKHLPTEQTRELLETPTMPLSENDYKLAFLKIAEGKSVRNCIADLNCSAWMFYEGIKNNKAISEQYAHARKLQAEASFEHILNLAEKVESGLLEPQAARVAIDTYKWVAARLHPQVYADKPLLDIGDNSPTEITVRWSSKPKELKDVSESTEPMELPE